MKRSTSKSTETVFIVDNDSTNCRSLAELLKPLGVATHSFNSGEEFLSAFNPQRKGCLLLEIRLPGMDGMELQEKLVKSAVTIPIIFMTAKPDIYMVKKTLKSGAVDFFPKPLPENEVLDTIEQVFQKQRRQQKKDSLISGIQTRVQSLTAREKEVLDLVTSGFTNNQISEKLYLALVTVKLHRGQVMRKMQAESLADLVRMVEALKTAEAANRR